jgi:hypothetical protein
MRCGSRAAGNPNSSRDDAPQLTREQALEEAKALARTEWDKDSA